MEQNPEILVDYLDKQLSPENYSRLTKQLNEDQSTATELEYLKLAVETVRRDALRNQVAGIRRTFESNQIVPVKNTGATVRTLYRTSLRIAALFMLLAGIAILYKYMTVNNQSVYEKQFTGYELSNTRGQSDVNVLSDAFLNKKWKEVTGIYESEPVHSNKSRFLAGMAEMQQDHFSQAVAIFENLLGNTIKTGDVSYQEESEYYLSLAYLMNHEVDKSVRMMNKIKADPGHVYYPQVSKISSIDLKIIELKK
jgi:hypothetical protein